MALTWEQFSQVLLNLILNMCLKITLSKLLIHLPRANELKQLFAFELGSEQNRYFADNIFKSIFWTESLIMMQSSV